MVSSSHGAATSHSAGSYKYRRSVNCYHKYMYHPWIVQVLLAKQLLNIYKTVLQGLGTLFRIIGFTFSLLPLLSACPSFLCKSSSQRVNLYTLNAPTGTALFWKQARQISSRKVIFHNYYLIATFSSSPLRLKAVLIQPGSSNSCSQALLTNRLIIKRSSEALCEAFSPKKQLKWRQKSLSSCLLLGHLCLWGKDSTDTDPGRERKMK